MSLDISHLQPSALTILGVATLVGFYAGRVARRIKLPSLIGYMLLGVLIGPSILHLLSESTMEAVSFIGEISLGLVAFNIGSELSIASLRRLGSGIVSIILAESMAAFLLVCAAIYVLTRDMPLALVFGAMAPASAPAGLLR